MPGRVKCYAAGEHVPVDGIIPAELAELMYQGDGKRRRILRTVYECRDLTWCRLAGRALASRVRTRWLRVADEAPRNRVYLVTPVFRHPVLARRRLPAIAAMPKIMVGPYAYPADFLPTQRGG